MGKHLASRSCVHALLTTNCVCRSFLFDYIKGQPWLVWNDTEPKFFCPPMPNWFFSIFQKKFFSLENFHSQHFFTHFVLITDAWYTFLPPWCLTDVVGVVLLKLTSIAEEKRRGELSDRVRFTLYIAQSRG